LACIRDGEIVVTDLATGAERQVTSGAAGPISNGTAEFVAQEEMGRRRGYWWSHDSQSIAFQQTDTSGVETFHIADAVKPESLPQPWPYPRPGGKNAVVKLGIVSAAGGQAKGSTVQWIEWDRERYPYLATVKWDENSPLTILVQNRAQTEEVLYAIDAKSGSPQELLRETDAAWINLNQACPLWLRNGGEFLWLTERTGEWSLELRSARGKLIRTLTPPQLGLVGLAGANEERGVAYVTVCDDPTQTQIYSVSLDGTGNPQRLTTGRGQNLFTIEKCAGAHLHSFSSADGQVKTRVVSAKGDVIGELKSVAEEPPFLPRPEYLTVGPQGFHAMILRPRSFDQSKKYPVVVHVYAGPQGVVVNSAPLAYLFEQWLADQGFIIVSIDGRGTPHRGRAWERAIKNNLIDTALQDQVQGLQALGAKFPEMDMSRVGIEGWSFGGYFSAMASMQRPDIYKAGVAGAPVCDFRDYDTHYTERYLGLPEENPAGYQASSVLTYCKDLSVPLLIIHGTADDNVYFFHSLKMAEALFRAGKKFEFLPLSGFTHMVPDPEVNVRRHSRVAAFFKEHLGAPR
jgi:dipeptidyl-peptidase-4